MGDNPYIKYLELADSVWWQELKIDVGKQNVRMIRNIVHEE